jgi:cell division transport system permease protein
VTLLGWPTRPRALPIAHDPARWCLVAIVAVMAYLAAIGGIGLIALGDARGDWDRALGNTLTLQLPADTSAARLEVVLALLRQTSGVTGVQALEPPEIARLLEPWLGKSVPVDIMPLPRLVDIRIGRAGALDVDGLRQRLQSAAPGAQLEDHRLWLTRLLSATSRLEAIVAVVVIAAAVVTALTAVVTAGANLGRNDELVALLHKLGADDLDIGGSLVIPAVGMSLLGGAIGALAAAGTLQVIAAAAGTLDLPSIVPAVTGLRVILLLIAVTFATGIIAAAAVALVARRQLTRLP